MSTFSMHGRFAIEISKLSLRKNANGQTMNFSWIGHQAPHGWLEAPSLASLDRSEDIQGMDMDSTVKDDQRCLGNAPGP